MDNKSGRKPKSRRNNRHDNKKRNTIHINGKEIELSEKVVQMSRVAKVVKGGRRFSFNALTVVGDSNTYVGIGFGKAKEVPEAIRKSMEDAKRNIVKIKKQGTTVPHKIIGKFKSARVLLKPSSPGTGIIAGEAVRAVVELAGVRDILTKSLGSSNKLNIIKATLDGLTQMMSIDDARKKRDITVDQMFGAYSKERRDKKREALGLNSPKKEDSSSEQGNNIENEVKSEVAEKQVVEESSESKVKE